MSASTTSSKSPAFGFLGLTTAPWQCTDGLGASWSVSAWAVGGTADCGLGPGATELDRVPSEGDIEDGGWEGSELTATSSSSLSMESAAEFDVGRDLNALAGKRGC